MLTHDHTTMLALDKHDFLHFKNEPLLRLDKQTSSLSNPPA
jgi:hypothetical protein